MCNCEYCIKCENCGHRCDEHLTEAYSCFMKNCACKVFKNKFLDTWERLSYNDKEIYNFQFEEFVKASMKLGVK